MPILLFLLSIGDPKSPIFCEISFRSKIRRVCWINLLLKKWEVTFSGSENQPFFQKRASSTSQFREHRDPIYCTQNISLYFCLENGDQNKKIGNSPCLSDQLALFKACVLISNWWLPQCWLWGDLSTLQWATLSDQNSTPKLLTEQSGGPQWLSRNRFWCNNLLFQKTHKNWSSAHSEIVIYDGRVDILSPDFHFSKQ